MPRVGIYVSEKDKALLDSLPREVTFAGLFRAALAQFRDQAEGCGHAHVVCTDCGATLETEMHTEVDTTR